MRSFKLAINPAINSNIEGALQRGFSPISSLSVRKEAWARVLRSISLSFLPPYPQKKSGPIQQSAEALVAEAVHKKEHGQRASWDSEGGQHVRFTTPTNVQISLKNEGGLLEITVDFIDRNSTDLGIQILAGFFKSGVTAAILPLAQVVNEAAAEYTKAS